MSLTYVTKTDVSPGTTGSYQSVDITSYVGGDAGSVGGALLWVQRDTGTAYTFGVRETGTSDANECDMSTQPHHFYIIVPTDSNDTFECYIENAAIVVYLVGYFGTECKGFGGAVSVASGTTNWADYDFTTDLGGDAGSAPAVFGYTSGGSFRTVGARKNGSTDDRQVEAIYFSSWMCGLDANDIAEFDIGGGNMSMYALGYFTDGVDSQNVSGGLETNCYDHSIGSTYSWTNTTVNAPTGGLGVILEVYSPGGQWKFGVRKDGDSDTTFIKCSRRAFFCPELASDIFEQEIENTSQDLFEHGVFVTVSSGAISGACTDGILYDVTAASQLTMPETCSDGMLLDDAAANVLSMLVTSSDGMLLSDASDRSLRVTASASSGVLMSESDAMTASMVGVSSDGITFDDAVSLIAQYVATVSDGITYDDVAAAVQTHRPVVTDGILLSDTIVGTLVGGLIGICTDGILYSDAASALATFAGTSTDGILFSDAKALRGILSAITIATDGVLFSDVPNFLQGASGVCLDGITLDDTASVRADFSVTVSDGILLSDVVAGIASFIVNVTDGLTLTDSSLSIIPSTDIVGQVTISFSTKKGSISFTVKKASVGMTASKPSVTYN